jgi:hypothetical protein
MTHREARIAYDEQIAKVESDLALNDRKIQTARVTEAKLERQFKDLGDKAADDDRGALRKQREIAIELESTQLQIRNLSKRAGELREALARLQNSRPTFVALEVAEDLKAELLAYPQDLEAVSAIIGPVAEKFAGLKKRLDQSVTQAIAIISGGNPERTRPLEDKCRTLLNRALRVHLAVEFRAAGFDLFETQKSDGESFKGIFEPFLESLVTAVAINLPPNGDGVRSFRCSTNVGGLLGLDLRLGEVVTLPVNDPAVARMIANGALEEISSLGAA